CKEVLDWYQQKMITAGYETRRTDDMPPGCGGILLTNSGNRARSLNVKLMGDSKSVTIDLEAVERERPGAISGNNVPSWVPIYPGCTPANVTNEQFGAEKHATFSIATQESLTTVINWYEARLKSAGFEVYASPEAGR